MIVVIVVLYLVVAVLAASIYLYEEYQWDKITKRLWPEWDSLYDLHRRYGRNEQRIEVLKAENERLKALIEQRNEDTE